MKKWTLIDEAGTLSLHERDGEYVIRVGGIELMSTRRHASEEALATIGLEGLEGKARILIGGLGFGFTLRAALARLPTAHILVAELSPAIIAWNKKLGLDPKRGRIVEGDVRTFLKEQYDAILLDVDNGPSALAAEDNHHLYTVDGLKTIARALRPGGRLAVWSVADSPAFMKRLRAAGFNADARKAYAREGGGGRHTIFVGNVPKKGITRAR